MGLNFLYFMFDPLLALAGTVKYTDCTSAEGLDPSNECPDMTLNNLIVRFP